MFAELAKGLVEWQKGLEGWDMVESQVIQQWQREARQDQEVKSLRKAVLQVLHTRCKAPAPEDVRLGVEGTNDLNTLSRWLDLAATVGSPEEFRKGMAGP